MSKKLKIKDLKMPYESLSLDEKELVMNHFIRLVVVAGIKKPVDEWLKFKILCSSKDDNSLNYEKACFDYIDNLIKIKGN